MLFPTGAIEEDMLPQVKNEFNVGNKVKGKYFIKMYCILELNDNIKITEHKIARYAILMEYFQGENLNLVATKIFNQREREKQLSVYKHYDQWFCMDTPRDKDVLNKLYRKGKLTGRMMDAISKLRSKG